MLVPYEPAGSKDDPESKSFPRKRMRYTIIADASGVFPIVIDKLIGDEK